MDRTLRSQQSEDGGHKVRGMLQKRAGIYLRVTVFVHLILQFPKQPTYHIHKN